MSSKTKKPSGKTQRSAIADVIAREYTIHMHRRVHGVSFKKRAPQAIKEIKAFAHKSMVWTPTRNPTPLRSPQPRNHTHTHTHGIPMRAAKDWNMLTDVDYRAPPMSASTPS